MLAVGGIVIFYKLTTKEDRARWGWNIVAIVVVGGIFGLLFSILKTGGLTE